MKKLKRTPMQKHASSIFPSRLVLWALLLTFTNTIFSQVPNPLHEPCGTDHLHQQLLQNQPEYARQIQKNEKQIQQLMKQSAQRMNGGLYTIPIVVHIIHKGEAIGQGTNISTEQVQTAISALNDDFRKMGNGNGNGVDVEIEFCLAQRDPKGDATTGILRVNGTGTCMNGSCYEDTGIEMGIGSNEILVKNLSNWPNTDYYNIWIVSEINGNDATTGVQGFAHYPGAGNGIDGAVILYNSFGADDGSCSSCNLKSYALKNRVATHEIGHALNLYHTFEGDRDQNMPVCPPIANTTNDGDFVTDTPPHIRSAQDCNASGTNDCYNNTSNSLYVHNYMDYSNEDCRNMFTEGQRARMRATLEGPRNSLLNSSACLPPCLGLTAGFDASAESVPVGTTIDFTNTTSNTSTGSTTYQWTVEGNSFPSTDLSYFFNNEGVFDICLEANNGICSDMECLSVTINGPGPCETAPNELINGDFQQSTQTVNYNCQLFNSEVPGWYTSHGTPTLLQSGGSDYYVRTWALNDFISDTRGLGIFNCYNFEAHKEYQICFRIDGSPIPSSFPYEGLRFFTWGTNGLESDCTAQSDLSEVNPSDQQLIGTFELDDLVGNVGFTEVSANFVPTQNFNQLWMYPLAMLPNTAGEVLIDDVEIIEIDPTEFSISPDQVLCPTVNPSIELLATGGQSYEWTPATGLTCTDCPNPIATPSTTTTYTAAITKDGLCGPIYRSVTITVDCEAICIPSPGFHASIMGCEVEFAGENNGDVGTFEWDFGDGTLAVGQNQNHSYSNSGTYQVCLTIECDDWSSATYCEAITVQCGDDCGFGLHIDTPEGAGCDPCLGNCYVCILDGNGKRISSSFVYYETLWDFPSNYAYPTPALHDECFQMGPDNIGQTFVATISFYEFIDGQRFLICTETLEYVHGCTTPPPAIPVLENQAAYSFPKAAVFPNPSNGSNLTLEFSAQPDAALTIEVFNINGQLVQSFAPVSFSEGYFKREWKIEENIASGLYLIRFSTATDTVVSKVLVSP